MNLPFAINMKYNCRQIFLLWFFTTSILLSAKAIDVPPDKEPLLFVNGYAVSIEEFRWFMQQERAGVFQYVKTRYNLDYGKGFWDHDCEGTTPKVMLHKRTIEHVVSEKVQQILFKELGLIQDTSYSVFLNNLEKLNCERGKAVQQGRVIYGPVRYTQLQYYGHWMANLQIQAKEKLSQEQFGITEQKLRAFYDEHKCDIFKMSETLTLEMVTIQVTEQSNPKKNAELLEATAKKILSKIKGGRGIEQIMQGYVDRKDIKVSCRRFDEINDDRLGEIFTDSENFKKVKALVPGQSLKLAVSENTVYVVKCISKTSGSYLPYENIKAVVKTKYLDQQYDQLVGDMVKKANIEINQKILEKLEPQ
jgi:hypothetical protein